VVVLNVIVAIE
ncbi:hypothetical protein A2U01_0110590, partial [Trifolium medium]|nr:hypothetical protein [Trifolium medium]